MITSLAPQKRLICAENPGLFRDESSSGSINYQPSPPDPGFMDFSSSPPKNLCLKFQFSKPFRQSSDNSAR